jgi:hypothetical protein
VSRKIATGVRLIFETGPEKMTMSNVGISKSRAACVLATVVLGQGAVAGDEPERGLTLTASVAQVRFLVGEPVLVELTLANGGPDDVAVWSDLSPDTQAVACEARGPDGTTRVFKPADIREPSGRATLGPGDKVTSLVDLRLLRLQWPEAALLFPTPGAYEIDCTYRAFLSADVVRPDPAALRITVVDPAGSPGAPVFARPAVGYFIDGAPDDAAEGALREIADEDGNEPFRVYARYYLGAHCLDEQTNPPEGDPTRCLADLTRAASVDFQLRDLALLKLARAEALSGRNLEALDHARRAVQVSVRPTTRSRAEALLTEISAAPATPPGPSSGSWTSPELAALIEEYSLEGSIALVELGRYAIAPGMLSSSSPAAGELLAAAGMELTLEANHKTYLLGEPVPLTVTATNAGREPVVTSLVLAPEAGFLQLFVSDDGERFRQYLGPGWGIRDVPLKPRPVLPGETRSVEIDLLWHHGIANDERFLQRPFAFDEEACYWLKASTLLPEFDSESNTIQICTTAPTGADLAVWERLVAAPELAQFIQWPITDVGPGIRARVEALLEAFPTTSYSPYLREALRQRREFDARQSR